MSESAKEAWAILATCFAVVFAAFFALEKSFKNDLKIEAVEHGYAHYVDGAWKWNHEQ